MNESQLNVSAADLQKQREAILRGLRRANTAALATLTVVVGLAVASIYAAFRAEQNAQRANEASARAEQQRVRAEEELWKSCLAQARALRLSGAMGRKADILEAVAAGARIRPSQALRNEAIAALALTDLRDSGRFQTIPTGSGFAIFDPDLEHYAFGDSRGFHSHLPNGG